MTYPFSERHAPGRLEVLEQEVATLRRLLCEALSLPPELVTASPSAAGRSAEGLPPSRFEDREPGPARNRAQTAAPATSSRSTQ